MDTPRIALPRGARPLVLRKRMDGVGGPVGPVPEGQHVAAPRAVLHGLPALDSIDEARIALYELRAKKSEIDERLEKERVKLHAHMDEKIRLLEEVVARFKELDEVRNG